MDRVSRRGTTLALAVGVGLLAGLVLGIVVASEVHAGRETAWYVGGGR